MCPTMSKLLSTGEAGASLFNIFFATLFHFPFLCCMDAKKVIEASGLHKHFGAAIAVNDLHMSVNEGEIFCLLGQNGAGKTTTLNMLMGFTAPTGGTATILGHKITKGYSAHKAGVSYIPEVVQLYPLLTGAENLDFFCKLGGHHLTAQEISQLLENTGLHPDAHHQRVGTYSKGMRQKVGIAIALAKQSRLILMDEPTRGLDPASAIELASLMKQLSSKGIAFLMATHDLFNAVEVGHTIGIMKQGKMVTTLPVASITAQSLRQIYLETI